jgi:hypothetical protein
MVRDQSSSVQSAVSTRRVDAVVEPPEVFVQLAERRGDGFAARYVGVERDGVATLVADAPGHLLAGLGVRIEDGDRDAPFGEGVCDRVRWRALPPEERVVVRDEAGHRVRRRGLRRVVLDAVRDLDEHHAQAEQVPILVRQLVELDALEVVVDRGHMGEHPLVELPQLLDARRHLLLHALGVRLQDPVLVLEQVLEPVRDLHHMTSAGSTYSCSVLWKARIWISSSCR